MRVFGHPMSTCTRKVLMALHEKEAPFEFELVDLAKGEHKQEAHLARQPFGQIPSIADDGFTLYESRAIIRYVDATLPGIQLSPNDPKGRATMEQWISVETSNFAPHAMKIIQQRMFMPKSGKQPDEGIVQSGLEVISRCCDVLGGQLSKSKYLVGDSFTLADLVYMPYITYLFESKAAEPITNHDNVARWWNEISSRPSWKKVLGQ
jgi:glutathione S-transferase